MDGGQPPPEVEPAPPKRQKVDGLRGFFSKISKTEQQHRLDKKVDALKEAGPCTQPKFKPTNNAERQQRFREKAKREQLQATLVRSQASQISHLTGQLNAARSGSSAQPKPIPIAISNLCGADSHYLMHTFGFDCGFNTYFPLGHSFTATLVTSPQSKQKTVKAVCERSGKMVGNNLEKQSRKWTDDQEAMMMTQIRKAPKTTPHGSSKKCPDFAWACAQLVMRGY
jgi:hypothetical protein